VLEERVLVVVVVVDAGDEDDEEGEEEKGDGEGDVIDDVEEGANFSAIIVGGRRELEEERGRCVEIKLLRLATQ
jgi:hypothetical protein